MTKDSSEAELLSVANEGYSELDTPLLGFIRSPFPTVWPLNILIPSVGGFFIFSWGIATHDPVGMVLGCFILIGAPWAFACSLLRRIMHLERRFGAVVQLLEKQPRN